jgi:hypothetical protein
MLFKKIIPLFAFLLGAISFNPILASQFYVFPVLELEGVSNSVPAERRPLIDPRVRALFTPTLQSEILEHFERRIAAVYPSSVVHAKQVSAATSNRQYSYQKGGGQCGEGFAAPVQQSYAVVLGLTRASWYQASKERGIQELLVPITINIQLIKPDQGKVAFSISETLYTPFRFGSVEELSRSAGIIQEEIKKGLLQQIDDLVLRLNKGFQPKAVTAKVIAETEGVMIVDKGYEYGFKVGDEPSSINGRTKTVNLFAVESVSSGYSVIKKLQGDAGTGDQLTFTFETDADDTAKPRAMPVYPVADLGKSAIAEYFAKDIGFSARFQITAIDTNFKDSQDSVERQANCVPWERFEATRKDFNSRKDAPNYFLTFDYAFSPVLLEAGYGGLETSETWVTTVSVSLVDRLGRIAYSDIGQDHYKLEKKAGKGLDINQAREISLKNATVAVSKKFIEKVRLEPKEFEITSATHDRYRVKGLAVSQDTTINALVVRPLSVKVNGREVEWTLRIDHDNAWNQQGDMIEFKYSSPNTKVRNGDKFRAFGLTNPKQKRIQECSEHFIGTGSMKEDHLLPVIKNSLLASERFLITIANPSFYETANYFLREGMFKLQLSQPNPDTECVKVGYSIKAEPSKCEKGKCSVEFLAASTIIVERSGQRIANFVQAEKISLTGLQQGFESAAVGYRAAESVSKSGAKLTVKLNEGK